MDNSASNAASESAYFATLGSAFQIFRSSKEPSLPMQPNSTLDLVGWAMPGGLEEGHGLAVDGGAHGVADGFEHEGVPGLGIEAEGEGDVLAAGGRGWLAGGAFGAGEGEAFLVHEGDLGMWI